MRMPRLLLPCVLAVAAVGVLGVSLTPGQGPAPGLPPTPPPGLASPAPPPAATSAKKPARDLARWSYFQQQVFLSGQRGADWLQRHNRLDGRFVNGCVPALRQPLEGDSYHRQAAAAFGLARAAQFYADDEAAAKARHAVLTLLMDTAPEDAKNPQTRVCLLPPSAANRLAAAGQLVQAIHELPAPGADLLDQSDQLCNYLRRQQRPDGSMRCFEAAADGKEMPDDGEAVNVYPGEALYGLMRSQQHRPAAWKVELVRKALPFYLAHWRAGKSLALVPRHTAAYTEAYMATKDKAFADAIFEMNDWLCTLQYQQLDVQHPLWVGGFMSWADGRPAATPPQVGAAACADSLAEACRVARQVGDAQRWEKYKVAVERCLQFLTTLQYTAANVQHFAEWYRPTVLGAFHAGPTDGNLRLDYTQQAVCAMVAYLAHVADAP